MTTTSNSPASALDFYPRKRSRGGCIDCKKAKVKCDELRPTCGTCVRRGHVCQGYRLPGARRSSKTAEASSPAATAIAASPVPSTATSLVVASSAFSSRRHSEPSLVPCTSLSPIPRGTVPEADEPTIQRYFDRHPLEFVIESDFVDEMNAHTLLVFQQDPQAIADTLYAVGQLYFDHADGHSPLVPALNRRARTLARLRKMQTDNELEQMIVMILGLSAMDLLDPRAHRDESSIPLLLSYCASIVSQHLHAGIALSSVARYFLRALARQDIVCSLVSMRRPQIPVAVWLDEACLQAADRVMGFTVTLMPLLEELCALAEDIREHRTTLLEDALLEDTLLEDTLLEDTSLEDTMFEDTTIATATDTTIATATHINTTSIDLETPLVASTGLTIAATAADLALRIRAWQPVATYEVSVRVSRRCLLQAYASRAAALLYLHRLLHPAGSSAEADRIALGMACEVLAHLSAPADELRLSLWPAFVAACELVAADDRATVLDIFDGIYRVRFTATALRTRAFCVDRVWHARDTGQPWNWMDLVQQYPGECLPI
ncbi:hypothetical protein ASPZODRAFT_149729 [Penicilliopsis zonata CBS 506.65]|uniref:Zn(2)-C6 fungal-type domain-containing protein n=1 Tax=Penicilliopsis zonata CBS 506.65 TaxID=1073090 RepID=A0A1L9ST68_9EURO|nr:hypothetical protein ASPZODRAFT_149729 [Penicilliopsis zonata CBS 506.65]OJJ50400.1 hypothetical protein ASPZODRAFT_149729 [Penicilliopsis zonata CBS 506.65]